MEEDAARARDEEVINLGMDAPLNFSANAERELRRLASQQSGS